MEQHPVQPSVPRRVQAAELISPDSSPVYGLVSGVTSGAFFKAGGFFGPDGSSRSENANDVADNGKLAEVIPVNSLSSSGVEAPSESTEELDFPAWVNSNVTDSYVLDFPDWVNGKQKETTGIATDPISGKLFFEKPKPVVLLVERKKSLRVEVLSAGVAALAVAVALSIPGGQSKADRLTHAPTRSAKAFNPTAPSNNPSDGSEIVTLVSGQNSGTVARAKVIASSEPLVDAGYQVTDQELNYAADREDTRLKYDNGVTEARSRDMLPGSKLLVKKLATSTVFRWFEKARKANLSDNSPN